MIHTTRFAQNAQSTKWIHVLVGRLSNGKGTAKALCYFAGNYNHNHVPGFFPVRFAITTAQNLKRFALMNER
jgi:hypothetical protein